MSGDLLNYMKRENEIVNHINLSLSLVTVQLRGQNWHWRGGGGRMILDCAPARRAGRKKLEPTFLFLILQEIQFFFQLGYISFICLSSFSQMSLISLEQNIFT